MTETGVYGIVVSMDNLNEVSKMFVNTLLKHIVESGRSVKIELVVEDYKEE